MQTLCNQRINYNCGYTNAVVNKYLLFPGFPVPLSAVRRMEIYDQQVTTMRVRWERAPGATGYMLLYSAINATQPTTEQEVRSILGNQKASSQSAVDRTEMATFTCVCRFITRMPARIHEHQTHAAPR